MPEDEFKFCVNAEDVGKLTYEYEMFSQFPHRLCTWALKYAHDIESASGYVSLERLTEFFGERNIRWRYYKDRSLEGYAYKGFQKISLIQVCVEFKSKDDATMCKLMNA